MSATIETTLPTVNARIYPRGGLDVLSRDEVARLRDASTAACTTCCAAARWRC